MTITRALVAKLFMAIWLSCLLLGCTSPQLADKQPTKTQLNNIQFLNRITWGANDKSLGELQKLGRKQYLERQLHPKSPAILPVEISAQIADLQISQKTMPELVDEAEQLRKQGDAGSDEEKQAARKQYQQFLNSLAQESAQRFMLRAVYSPNQLQENLTWFWLNHFSVSARKNNIRAIVADYEDQAIRPHVLGRFRDLLAASVYHAAMLSYLDNEKNVAGRINENYARELMELHTLGVDGGYNQHDVQELARILTGLGIDRDNKAQSNGKKGKPNLAYEKNKVVFNTRKHDGENKTLLGENIHSQGFAEIDEALDRLSRHPATAHFISRKLALYFMGDNPSPGVVESMANTFLARDGDIKEVLRTLFNSPEFNDSLGKKFKDPVHYVASSMRLIYGDVSITNISPAIKWLDKMGEPLYGHQTPDGYPLNQSSWSSPGQMTTRFDVARSIAATNLSPIDANDKNHVPDFKPSNYTSLFQPQLSSATQQALAQAKTPQEWNTFFLSSPEFMKH